MDAMLQLTQEWSGKRKERENWLNKQNFLGHFICKKSEPDFSIHTDSWAVANGLASWSGTWKEQY